MCIGIGRLFDRAARAGNRDADVQPAADRDADAHPFAYPHPEPDADPHAARTPRHLPNRPAQPDRPAGHLHRRFMPVPANEMVPDNAAPGTIVIPIMFHGIPAIETTDPNEINQLQFEKLIADLKEQGFEAITISQLADFLETNAKIPPRSFVMILDDRRPGTAYATFLPVLEANKWRMSLAWPIGYGDDTTDKKPATYVESDPLAGTYPNLWAQIEHYYESGYFEVELHGYYHNFPMSNDSTDDYLRQELEQSMAELEAHFGRRPVAIIWPGVDLPDDRWNLPVRPATG